MKSPSQTSHMFSEFSIGLVVNPYAGLGGPAALKGSDHKDTVSIAKQRGVESKVPQRVEAFLDGLKGIMNRGLLGKLRIVTCDGEMGAGYVSESTLANEEGVSLEIVYPRKEQTSGKDTEQAVELITKTKVDLLVFVGGDGTARNVCQAVDIKQLVLGLPAGVKMHSGVFAVTPNALVSVVESLVSHKLVAARMAEVRDIDEQAFQQGKVSSKYFGEMLIPDDQLLVQSVKCSGMLDDELMLDELSEFIDETLEEDSLYILGSGGTLKKIKERLGIELPTLLGVDVLYVTESGEREVIATDVHEAALYDILKRYKHAKIILSVIGGQGVVLGRGNQQVSARVIRQAGIDNLHFVSTQNKLLALEGKALRVDSGDNELDKLLAGYHPILCGYDDTVLYEIAYL